MPVLHETSLTMLSSGVRTLSLSTDYSFPRHSHDEFGLGLITEGGHRSHSGRGEVEATKGDMISVCPGEVHDGMPMAGRMRSWTMLYVSASRLFSIAADDCAASKGTELEFVSPVISPTSERRHVQSLFHLLSQGAYSAKNEFDEALTDLIVPLIRKRKPSDHPAVRSIAAVIEYIHDDPSSHMSLDELARLAGASRFQTIRAVKRQTGFTPFGLIRQKRLELARRLIFSGSSISDAAIQAGFSDQAHLTRAFRSTYGVTPGMFVRSRDQALQ